MRPKLPAGTRAERLQFVRDLRRQQELERPRVRLSRTWRRVSVAGLGLSVLSTAAWLSAWAADVVSGRMATGVAYGLLAAQTVMLVVLTYSVGNLTRGNDDLDERERAQRDHATASAYKILSGVVGTATLAAIAANVFFTWHPDVNPKVGVMPFLFTFIWFVAGLPMAVMAWTLSDPAPATEASRPEDSRS
jgi:hypothetical protein